MRLVILLIMQNLAFLPVARGHFVGQARYLVTPGPACLLWYAGPRASFVRIDDSSGIDGG